jgi:hypothetical protein
LIAPADRGYGDFDVDGVSATVLLVEVLRAYGAAVEPYIPNRFDEGFGLNNEALSACSGKGIRLVIRGLGILRWMKRAMPGILAWI